MHSPAPSHRILTGLSGTPPRQSPSLPPSTRLGVESSLPAVPRLTAVSAQDRGGAAACSLSLPAQGQGPEAVPGPSCRNWSAPLPPCPRRAAIGLCQGLAACDSRQRIPGGAGHWLSGWSEDSETRAASQSSARQPRWRRGAARARDGVTGRGSRAPGVALATKLPVPRLPSAVDVLGSILLPTLTWLHPKPGEKSSINVLKTDLRFWSCFPVFYSGFRSSLGQVSCTVWPLN